MLLHSVLSDMADLQARHQINNCAQSMFPAPRSKKRNGTNRFRSHMGMLLQQQSDQVVESIESQQREFFQLLLENRDDQAHLNYLVENKLRMAAATGTQLQQPTAVKKKVLMQRSELEVISSFQEVAAGNGSVFTSLKQA